MLVRFALFCSRWALARRQSSRSVTVAAQRVRDLAGQTERGRSQCRSAKGLFTPPASTFTSFTIGGKVRAGNKHRVDDFRKWLGGEVYTYRMRLYNPGGDVSHPSRQQREISVGYNVISLALLAVIALLLLLGSVRRSFKDAWGLLVRVVRRPARRGFPLDAAAW